MVKPVNRSKGAVVAPIAKGQAKNVSPVRKSKDTIEQIQNSNVKQISNRENTTNFETEKFIKRASLFTTLNIIYNFCHVGPKDSGEDDFNKMRLIVKKLSKYDNPGFFTIRRVMKKHFSNISFIKAFFYYGFAKWIPKLYIRKSTEKFVDFFRTNVQNGTNLPALGGGIIGNTNKFLANYNRSVERFRDDSSNLIGDKDSYVRRQLKKEEILGCSSVDNLYKNFASAASREDVRPTFRKISLLIVKLQKLDFEILSHKDANPLLKGFRFFIKPLTMLIGAPFFLAARFVEWFPNRVIKYVHKKLIAYFMPSVIQNTVEAVGDTGFTHGINTFICDLIQDILTEMKKRPEDKEILDIPNIVNESLSKEIMAFSKHLYTLLQREPYKTQEELQYLKENGPDSNSLLEGLVSWGYGKKDLEKNAIHPIYVTALHSIICDAFNTMLGRPEKAEEYLANMIIGLNKVFDHAPGPNTEEGRALAEEQKDTTRRRNKLVNELLEKGISQSSDDTINQSFGILSNNQKATEILQYRKIKTKSASRLPTITSDAENILKSSNFAYPKESQTKLAEQDIEKALKDINRLSIAIRNIINEENGPIKKEMTNHLKPFLNKKNELNNNIITIKTIHNVVEDLKKIEKELRSLKKSLNSLTENNIDTQLPLIKKHFDKLNRINQNHQFDPIVNNYMELSNQLEKILMHQKFAKKLNGFVSSSYFSKGLLRSLATAQRAYLGSPGSHRKEQMVIYQRNRVFKLLEDLTKIYPNDVKEIKDIINQILHSHLPIEVDEAYKSAENLIKRKTLAHKSLYRDERDILPKYYDKCKVVIEKQLNDFYANFEEQHTKLMNEAEKLKANSESLQSMLEGIGKKNILSHVNFKEISKLAVSAAGFYAPFSGYLGSWIVPKLFVGGVFGAAPLIVSWPVKKIGAAIGRGAASSFAVPLAKSTVESAYEVMVNKPFYEGLIHRFMGQFTEYMHNLKK